MIKITGIDKKEKCYHSFGEYYAFIDDQDDFFIVGRDDTVIMLTSDTFMQYNYSDCDTIETFCSNELGTKLVKGFDMEDFDIEIKIKEEVGRKADFFIVFLPNKCSRLPGRRQIAQRFLDIFLIFVYFANCILRFYVI